MIPCLIFFLTFIFIIQSKNNIYLNNQLNSSIHNSKNENEFVKLIINKYSLSQFIFYDPQKYISNTNSIINYMKEIYQNQQLKVFIFLLSEIPHSENIQNYLLNIIQELEKKFEKKSISNNLGILILIEQNKYSYYLSQNIFNQKLIIEIINQNLNKKISKSNIDSIIKNLLLKINTKETEKQKQILLSGMGTIIIIFFVLVLIIIFILIFACFNRTTTTETYTNYANDGYYIAQPPPTTQVLGLGVVNKISDNNKQMTNFQANLNINISNNNLVNKKNYYHKNYNTNPYTNDYYYKTGNHDRDSYGGGGNFGDNESYGGGGDLNNNNNKFGGGGNFINNNNNNNFDGGGNFINNNNNNFGGGGNFINNNNNNNNFGGGGNFINYNKNNFGGGGNFINNNNNFGEGVNFINNNNNNNFQGGHSNDNNSDGGDGNFGGDSD